MSLNNTPMANRLHIGIFGRTNSGKSTLINALTGQEIALTSPIAGTTADPVYKTMEVKGIGPCVFIDTAGFDDETNLGSLRIEQTKKAIDKTDIALLVFSGSDFAKEKEWLEILKSKKIPVLAVLNKIDEVANPKDIADNFEKQTKLSPVLVSASNKIGLDELRTQITSIIPENFDSASITGNLCSEGDVVMLVMPQDVGAPKGRLILPQTQTLRELLDKKCIPICCTNDMMEKALSVLENPPKLIITDSQVFADVFRKKPEGSDLTSFSVLFANYKGDINAYMNGARAIENLNENSKVLIAECCTHVPQGEDIGTVKLPKLLRKKVGEGLQIKNVTGNDFPKDLSEFDLVISCGGCMFNRKFILSRIDKAHEQSVPITNYGIVIAYLSGILDDVVY